MMHSNISTFQVLAGRRSFLDKYKYKYKFNPNGTIHPFSRNCASAPQQCSFFCYFLDHRKIHSKIRFKYNKIDIFHYFLQKKISERYFWHYRYKKARLNEFFCVLCYLRQTHSNGDDCFHVDALGLVFMFFCFISCINTENTYEYFVLHILY